MLPQVKILFVAVIFATAMISGAECNYPEEVRQQKVWKIPHHGDVDTAEPMSQILYITWNATYLTHLTLASAPVPEYGEYIIPPPATIPNLNAPNPKLSNQYWELTTGKTGRMLANITFIVEGTNSGIILKFGGEVGVGFELELNDFGAYYLGGGQTWIALSKNRAIFNLFFYQPQFCTFG